MTENEKIYLKPNYGFSDSKLREESLSPREDDDDDDIDDSIDESDEATQEIENILDNQDRINNNKNSSMQSTPFGQSVNNNPWGSSFGNSGSSTWGNSWGGSNYGSSSIGSSSWNNPWRPTVNPWSNNQPSPSFNSYNNYSGGWGNTFKKEEIKRSKKIIFCDLLDCLIETIQSNGRPGLIPRGIYDIRLKFEVWDKIRCFDIERIYVISPNITTYGNNEDSWAILINYVLCSLSEYLRIPFQNCQILMQSTIGQPKDEILKFVLKSSGWKRKLNDALLIGLNSGYSNQSNSDFLAAKQCGIDYVDLNSLVTNYS